MANLSALLFPFSSCLKILKTQPRTRRDTVNFLTVRPVFAALSARLRAKPSHRAHMPGLPTIVFRR